MGHNFDSTNLIPWWRHQIGIFSALLALFGGNPPVTGGFRHKDKWHEALILFLWYVPEETVEQTIETPVGE